MSDSFHLLIPFAGCRSPGAREAIGKARIPNLRKLLARLDCVHSDEGDGSELSMPHERALARAWGIASADGLAPWAAWHRERSGAGAQDEAWAWITPCHWRVGTGHVRMEPPEALQLSAEDAQALVGAMQPYFEQDGIRLAYESPTRWIASGGFFRSMPCASLDRVAGRVIDAWMPRGDAARPLRRLQQEMQMLLYTHPVNDARSAAGLLPVNSFWVSGAGALPAGWAGTEAPQLEVDNTLRDAALIEDAGAWALAWEQVDANACARALALLDSGRTVTLTLCGERRCRTLAPAVGLWRRLARTLQRPNAPDFLETL